MDVPQEEIDMMTGIAIRRLGLTVNPDVLIELVLRTVKRCEMLHIKTRVYTVFDELIDDYLARGRRFL